MKRLYLIMAAVVLIAIGTHIALANVGYHRIVVEGGTLFGKAMGKDQDVVVLLVAGSGPTTMDGNSDLIKGRNDSFLMLARGLAREGISTFRYDKRTAGKSAATFDLEAEIEFDAFVRDCAAVVAYLREQGYKKVVVAGHSQDSLVGMLTAEEVPVDGFISLAGTGLPIDVTLEKQLLAQLPEDSLEIKVLRTLREGKTDPSVPDGHQFSLANQKFLLSWMAHDPASVLNRLDMPRLVIHGDADLQVDLTDFQALKDGAGAGKHRVIPNMNHVLKEVLDDAENAAAYADPSYPLHGELIPVLVEFITSLLD